MLRLEIRVVFRPINEVHLPWSMRRAYKMRHDRDKRAIQSNQLLIPAAFGFNVLDPDPTSYEHQPFDLRDIELRWRPREATSYSNDQLRSEDLFLRSPQPLRRGVLAALNG